MYGKLEVIMETLNLALLLKSLDKEIAKNECEINHAITQGWFDKAAKLNNEISGLNRAKMVAQSGDCHT